MSKTTEAALAGIASSTEPNADCSAESSAEQSADYSADYSAECGPDRVLDYRIEPHCLGSGAYSVVRRAVSSSGTHVVCKQLRHRLRAAQECVAREVTALRRLHDTVAHPLIVQLQHVHHDDEYAYLFLDSPRGAVTLRNFLDQHVARQAPISEHVIRHVVHSVATAVHYCHVRGVCHRDLKLENILIVPHSLQVLLIDFGLALTHAPHVTPLVRECQGSPLYLAPEVLSGGAHSPRAGDMWALGVVAHVLLFGAYPYSADSLDDLVLATRRPYTCPAARHGVAVAAPLVDVLSRLLRADPNTRLTAAQLLHHAWLAAPS